MNKFSQAFHISWPYVALIVAHLIWGANFIAAKLTLQEIPPLTLAFLRFSLATICLLPFVLTTPKSLKIASSDLPKLFLVGVLMVTLHIGFFFEGLQRTSVAQASALILLIPLFSAAAGWWILKEKFNWINMGGILFGFLGAGVIVGLGAFTNNQINPSSLVGNILIILCSVFWVIGALLSKKLLNHYSTLTLTWMMFLVGSITFLIPAMNEYIQNPGWVKQMSLLGALGLTYITLGSSVCSFFLFEWSVKRVGVYKADLFQYIEPVIATSLGVMILGEVLVPTFGIGVALVTLGALMGTYTKHTHHIPHKANRG